ncbi:Asp23/Gls24 family envelope stress response protein [Pseudonocardia asaccharolytica]|uniref:Asp23/Gls24 family envelope stress response protein n=1 Tax=Pseudonocardia asaccharolytica DSM 44247 = NBRC 16224 TaxID=1123024 RepID=A0A511D6Y7_9PSEU|nr:Asp23/Gls24 family envelope stress response protein [Pseudonocardia asaccharolytica]GEL20549.1 hypothetical protein PA7_43860 [Pseudonocardia asaccharolytica DSM 44247 = NBRC 16224]
MSSGELRGARLACGAEADDLLAQVAEGRAGERTPHQRLCPHCQATLAEYDRAWAPVRELAARKVHAPGEIVEAALRHIRGAAENPTYGLLTNGDGITRIAARVVAVTARETAARVSGVRVALSRLPAADTRSDQQADAGVAGESTAIKLTLAADYGQDLHALAERIRSEVTNEVRTLTGLDPVVVSVVIDDVFS